MLCDRLREQICFCSANFKGVLQCTHLTGVLIWNGNLYQAANIALSCYLQEERIKGNPTSCWLKRNLRTFPGWQSTLRRRVKIICWSQKRLRKVGTTGVLVSCTFKLYKPLTSCMSICMNIWKVDQLESFVRRFIFEASVWTIHEGAQGPPDSTNVTERLPYQLEKKNIWVQI